MSKLAINGPFISKMKMNFLYFFGGVNMNMNADVDKNLLTPNFFWSEVQKVEVWITKIKGGPKNTVAVNIAETFSQAMLKLWETASSASILSLDFLRFSQKSGNRHDFETWTFPNFQKSSRFWTLPLYRKVESRDDFLTFEKKCLSKSMWMMRSFTTLT